MGSGELSCGDRSGNMSGMLLGDVMTLGRHEGWLLSAADVEGLDSWRGEKLGETMARRRGKRVERYNNEAYA